jgi:hypothetical protein
MGGSNDPSNLVELTVEEHAEAHKKLWEEHGRWQDELAYKILSGAITAEEGRLLAVKNAAKGNTWNRGRIHTQESSMKKSLATKGKPKSMETRLKMSKPKSQPHRDNIKKNHADFSGVNNPMYGRKRKTA